MVGLHPEVTQKSWKGPSLHTALGHLSQEYHGSQQPLAGESQNWAGVKKVVFWGQTQLWGLR